MPIANSTLTAYRQHTNSIPAAYTAAYCIFHDILRFVWVQRPARKNCIFDYLFIETWGIHRCWPLPPPQRFPRDCGKYSMLLCMLLVCCRYAVGVLLATCITTPDSHALDAAHSSTTLLSDIILHHFEAASEPGFQSSGIGL